VWKTARRLGVNSGEVDDDAREPDRGAVPAFADLEEGPFGEVGTWSAPPWWPSGFEKAFIRCFNTVGRTRENDIGGARPIWRLPDIRRSLRSELHEYDVVSS
jgi:hypothetical protein